MGIKSNPGGALAGPGEMGRGRNGRGVPGPRRIEAQVLYLRYFSGAHTVALQLHYIFILLLPPLSRPRNPHGLGVSSPTPAPPATWFCASQRALRSRQHEEALAASNAFLRMGMSRWELRFSYSQVHAHVRALEAATASRMGTPVPQHPQP